MNGRVSPVVLVELGVEELIKAVVWVGGHLLEGFWRVFQCDGCDESDALRELKVFVRDDAAFGESLNLCLDDR